LGVWMGMKKFVDDVAFAERHVEGERVLEVCDAMEMVMATMCYVFCGIYYGLPVVEKM